MTGFWRISVTAFAAAAFALLVFGVARAEPSAVPLPRTAPVCDREDFRVVVDVGHTADSPGAMSARGISEYDYNIRLAEGIDEALLEAGFSKTVLLVTDGPGKKSLYDRVARLSILSPDLLLSIHHDSVPNKFKKEWEVDGKQQFYSDRFKGHSIFVSHDNARRAESLAFASLLGSQLSARGLQYTPHYTESFMGRYRRTLLDAETGVYRYDALFVLKKPRMPAVLFEAGSIVNRAEEVELGTAERRKLISAAVVDAVKGFCLAQAKSGPRIEQSARRKEASALPAGSRLSGDDY
jgi:N-acetylmuramoyl-L-alanine amidase